MKEELGNCYQVAGNMILNDGIPGLVLCHGYPFSPSKGRRIRHAWCELGDVVFDFSNEKEVVTRKEIYYEIGKLNERFISRYSEKEAKELMLETGHYGDWLSESERKKMLSDIN